MAPAATTLTADVQNYKNTAGTTLLALGNPIVQTNNDWSNTVTPGFKANGLMDSATLSGSGTTFEMNSRWKTSSGASTYVVPQTGYGLGQFTVTAFSDTAALNQVNAGKFQVVATENWSGSATGTKAILGYSKDGVYNTNIDGLTLTTAAATLKSNTIAFQDTTGTSLTGDKLTYTRTYGEFAYTNAAGFNIPLINTIYAMPLDTTNYSSGITTSSTSRVNINISGTYKLIMSLQAAMTTNSVGTFDFWLRKNGSDVANSKTQVDLLKDQKSVIAMDWMVQSNGSDYFEIVYASSSINFANISFPTIAATTVPYASPLGPALLLNVIPVGA
jgi:hypothetical protein